jgi:hypothetical protein
MKHLAAKFIRLGPRSDFHKRPRSDAFRSEGFEISVSSGEPRFPGAQLFGPPRALFIGWASKNDVAADIPGNDVPFLLNLIPFSGLFRTLTSCNEYETCVRG